MPQIRVQRHPICAGCNVRKTPPMDECPRGHIYCKECFAIAAINTGECPNETCDEDTSERAAAFALSSWERMRLFARYRLLWWICLFLWILVIVCTVAATLFSVGVISILVIPKESGAPMCETVGAACIPVGAVYLPFFIFIITTFDRLCMFITPEYIHAIGRYQAEKRRVRVLKITNPDYDDVPVNIQIDV